MIARILCLAVAVLWVLPAFAEDNIERSCKAFYRLHLSGISATPGGEQLIRIAETIGGVGNPDGSFGFSARRGCGRTVPDRCRRRASDAAMACMEAHAKSPKTMPPQCKSDGVEGYKIEDLETVVRKRVCAEVPKQGISQSILPRPYYVKTTIKGNAAGDSGCGGGDRDRVERDLSQIDVACPVQ